MTNQSLNRELSNLKKSKQKIVSLGLVDFLGVCLVAGLSFISIGFLYLSLPFITMLPILTLSCTEYFKNFKKYTKEHNISSAELRDLIKNSEFGVKKTASTDAEVEKPTFNYSQIESKEEIFEEEYKKEFSKEQTDIEKTDDYVL
ncbi:MAG TPA: hypothetical protein DDW20_01570 [Firmicutes bacterium]|nr:hypothetical protein [Bacillota bacterium]